MSNFARMRRIGYTIISTFLLLAVLVVGLQLGSTSSNAASSIPIYNDNLASGWVDWSWGSTVNFSATTYVQSGTRSAKVVFNQAWAGLYLHNAGVSTAGMSALKFYINGGTSGNQQINVYAEDTTGIDLPLLSLNNYISGGSVRAKTWQAVSIPLTDLGIGANPMTGLVLMDAKGKSQPAFFVDTIQLVPSASVVSATATATATTVTTATPTPTATQTGVTPTTTPPPTATPTATLTPVPSNSALPWLKTSGNQIVSLSGQKVTLHGANLLRSEWVYPDMTFEKSAIPTLANKWHGNLITHGFAANPVNANDPTYLSVLDQYVQLATSNHMYINLCYYYDDINGNQPPMPTQAAQDALVKLVVRYKAYPNVMFQLQAEPHDSIWYDPNRTDVLLPIFNRMVSAMRAVDNPAPYKHLILAPGDGWGRDVSLAVQYPITADKEINIVYSSHPYDPQSQWGYFLDAFNAGKPVIVTEFGTGSQMSQTDTNALITLMHNNNIPWTAWTFDTEGSPDLLSGDRMTFTASSPYGTSVQNEMMQTPPLPAQ